MDISLFFIISNNKSYLFFGYNFIKFITICFILYLIYINIKNMNLILISKYTKISN